MVEALKAPRLTRDLNGWLSSEEPVVVVAGSCHRVRALWVVRVLVTWTPHRTILKSYKGKLINGNRHECPLKFVEINPSFEHQSMQYIL